MRNLQVGSTIGSTWGRGSAGASLQKVVLAGTAVCIAATSVGTPVFASRPAAPSVVRVSDVVGRADVLRSDSKQTFAAARNAPLNSGDYLATSQRSRAEVDLGYGSVMRAAPETQLRFTQVEAQKHVAQLGAGMVEVRAFRGVEAHPLIETPAVDIRPGAAGRYRIGVDRHGDTIVGVRSGSLDLAIRGGSVTDRIRGGGAVLVTGYGDGARFRPIRRLAYDDFDRWCDNRDNQWADVRNWAYVDDDLIGVQDLSEYGHWISYANYGNVWVPADEPADWSPYADGRWTWEPYYGWTWVGYEPWGYAPYHYGRWFYAADVGWVWDPGAIAGPFEYQPALVAFVALGNGFSFSLEFGDIGWVPLAPGEPFYPWWGDSAGSISVAAVDVRGMYRNARISDAVVAESRRDWVDGDFSHVRHLRLGPHARLRPVRGVMPVVPTAHDLAYAPKSTTMRALVLAGAFRHIRGVAPAAASFQQQRKNVATVLDRRYPSLAKTSHQAVRSASTIRRTTATRPSEGSHPAATIGRNHHSKAHAAPQTALGSHPVTAAHAHGAAQTAAGAAAPKHRAGQSFGSEYYAPHRYAAVPHNGTQSHTTATAPHTVPRAYLQHAPAAAVRHPAAPVFAAPHPAPPAFRAPPHPAAPVFAAPHLRAAYAAPHPAAPHPAAGAPGPGGPPRHH